MRHCEQFMRIAYSNRLLLSREKSWYIENMANVAAWSTHEMFIAARKCNNVWRWGDSLDSMPDPQDGGRTCWMGATLAGVRSGSGRTGQRLYWRSSDHLYLSEMDDTGGGGQGQVLNRKPSRSVDANGREQRNSHDDKGTSIISMFLPEEDIPKNHLRRLASPIYSP
jgi:hypothetical protein